VANCVFTVEHLNPLREGGGGWRKDFFFVYDKIRLL
jgi:hypothetical protein